MSDNKWPTATKERPCPKCDKPNRCKVAPDGLAGFCWRDGTGKPWHSEVSCQDRPKATKAKKVYASAEDAIRAAEKSTGGKFAGAWTYPHDVARIVRFNLPDGKQFRPISRVSDGWCVADPAGLWPLYRGDELVDGPVIVTEGEGCADRAKELGFMSVTSAHGSASAHKSDWKILAGRDVIILPDNDDPGESYAKNVTAILQDIGARVKIVRLPGLPPGGDIVEFDAEIAAEPEATRDEIRKTIDATPWEAKDEKGECPVLINMSDVQPKQIDWLWPGRFALGRIGLIVGRPGEGKSFVTLDMASRISTGMSWPDGTTCPKGSVLLVCAEDNPYDTIRPRLDAHHAELSKIVLMPFVRVHDGAGKSHEKAFTLENIPILEKALKQMPDCRLIVVNPIGSYIGGRTDAHRDNEVRAVLSPLAQLAEKYNVATIIVSHSRKSASTNADEMALGSRAFTGIARTVWHLSSDPQNKERRLFLTGKNNLARAGDGLAFSIIDGAVSWEADPVQMNADDALAEVAEGPGRPPCQIERAKGWLRDKLSDLQEHFVDDLVAKGEDENINKRTLQRAARDIGVISERSGFGGKGIWRLPKPASVPNGSNTKSIGMYGENGNIGIAA